MIEEQFSRTEMVLGSYSIEKLRNSSVIIFGLGGVGSYIAEAVARSGVGTIALVDSDTVAVSNLNRQLCALHSTIGLRKTDVVEKRILDINPDCRVIKYSFFYLPEESNRINLADFDYIADAIDTVSAKIELAIKASELGIPIISCMGTGNKTDPSLFRISDISKTSVCPLCRVMRYELRKRGVSHLNVVWSPEEPVKTDNNSGRVPGSLPFVPGAAGLVAASKIIKDICG